MQRSSYPTGCKYGYLVQLEGVVLISVDEAELPTSHSIDMSQAGGLSTFKFGALAKIYFPEKTLALPEEPHYFYKGR